MVPQSSQWLTVTHSDLFNDVAMWLVGLFLLHFAHLHSKGAAEWCKVLVRLQVIDDALAYHLVFVEDLGGHWTANRRWRILLWQTLLSSVPTLFQIQQPLNFGFLH